MELSAIEERLEALWRRNASGENAKAFPQERTPGIAVQRIATLHEGVDQAVTPMLEVRFGWCGRWINATPGHTWLDPRELASAAGAGAVRRQVEVRSKHWPESVLARFPWSRISLLSIDPEEFDETYLLWPDNEGPEPAIFRYTGSTERIYEDFAAYLEGLLGP